MSKSVDHCSGWFNEDGCNPQDPSRWHDNWGYSAFDIPHVFTTSWVYEIPVGAGSKFQTGSKILDHILGPWQLNGILRFASGQNYHVGVSGDLANTGNAGSNKINGGYRRAHHVGEARASNASPDRWLNPSAFEVPAPFTFGNMERHAVQGDGLGNLDLSIFRKFRFLEDKVLELRVAMFNATNSPTWNRPVAQLRQPEFRADLQHAQYRATDPARAEDPLLVTKRSTRRCRFGGSSEAASQCPRLLRAENLGSVSPPAWPYRSTGRTGMKR